MVPPLLAGAELQARKLCCVTAAEQVWMLWRGWTLTGGMLPEWYMCAVMKSAGSSPAFLLRLSGEHYYYCITAVELSLQENEVERNQLQMVFSRTSQAQSPHASQNSPMYEWISASVPLIFEVITSFCLKNTSCTLINRPHSVT